MYNVKEYTFSSCTDIRAWEHKLTFVWLESCKRTVLNTKTHMRKEGGPGGGRHGWRTKETISNPRSGNGASSPLLVFPFCTLLEETPPLKWQHTPEGVSLVARAQRQPVSPGLGLPVHWQAKRAQCMYRTRSHTREGRHIAQRHRGTRTHTPSPPVLQLQLTCTVPYVHACSPPLTPVHHALTFWCCTLTAHLPQSTQPAFVSPHPFAECHRLKLACARRLPESTQGTQHYQAARQTSSVACCALQVFCCTSYCSREAPCPGTHPTPSKKKKKKKPHPSLSPGRVVCEFLLCCASFMPC